MEKKDLYLLTGFLGSGKTTLLLNLLDKLSDKKVGIIQNEFGKLSIDGEIIKRDGITMTEISRGSIFCSCLKQNFVDALVEMARMDLDYVFVESSGLADPSNIEEILDSVDVLIGNPYDFKAAICLIDAVNFLNQINAEETVYRQLAHCHMALINKADLVDENELSEVIKEVKAVNPLCKIEVSKFANIDLDFMNEDLAKLKWAENEDSLNTADSKPKTISMETDAIISHEDFDKFLKAVLPSCYRIKGFFHLDDGWKQVDVVEKLIDYKDAEEKSNSNLVFLSKIGPKVIREVDKAWKEIIKEPMKLKN